LNAAGRRVVSDHDVVYVPSATGLARLATTATRSSSARILLHDARNNLPHGGEEANAVISLVDAIQKTGSDATIAALRAAENAALLHVIGHSGVDHDGGYLVLADGHVTAADIVGWGVRPRLVVLPTCASAATSKHDMWGSLAVAFLAAGSANVVATLFSVEDAHAVAFTKAFYAHQGSRDPVGAVSAAQREMIANRLSTSVWSAFVVVGL
jgi:CHAT domain-containing protein